MFSVCMSGFLWHIIYVKVEARLRPGRKGWMKQAKANLHSVWTS